ncbi:MAG: ABC transporter ATP-binding protein [Nitrososphaeria archaeon]|nr:ABC transporter ATP-binding protein [Nitrososphaeria archaeon]
MASNVLEVEKLNLAYKTLRGDLLAVNDVSFSLKPGETLGIVGESGCGKSSTAYALMKMIPSNTSIFTGKIIVDGENIMEMDDSDLRKKVRWKKISMVFQGAMNSLNPVIKVGFQVAEPLIVHDNVPKKEALEKAKELFKLVGLPQDFINRYPHELSGGMKQRVVIAMSLVLNPKILILDEPTSALDVMIQAQIMNMLKDLRKSLNLSIIFITHDIALASDLCDKIAVMYGGQIMELGTAEQVLLDPRHPYASKLIGSIPTLRSDKKLEFIPGAPPDLVNPPPGCRFSPRCPYRFELCDKEEPPIYILDGGRQIRCFLYKEKGQGE